MKIKAIFTALCFGQVCLLGQGTVQFCNILPWADVPADSIELPLDDGNAQLWVGNPGAADLTPVFNDSSEGESPTQFFLGRGLFNGQVVTLSGFGGGVTVQLQIRVWSRAYPRFVDVLNTDGALYLESNAFSYRTGGDRTGGAEAPPSPLEGLTGFVLKRVNIQRPPLRIQADNKTKIFGANLPTLTASYIGLVPGDTLESAPQLSTTATASSPIGPYPITVTGGADPNYEITRQNGTLTIAPAPLTIIAEAKTKIFGANLPALTASYAGLLPGDTLESAPQLSTTATASSPVGTYPITVTGGADPNYELTRQNGYLSI